MAGGGGQVTADEEKNGVNKETAPAAIVGSIHAHQTQTLVIVQSF